LNGSAFNAKKFEADGGEPVVETTGSFVLSVIVENFFYTKKVSSRK
jgi:hypothetical protein